MSILFHDGFDHYGTGTGLTGSWLQTGGFISSGYKKPTQPLNFSTAFAKVVPNVSGAAQAVGISINSSNNSNQIWISRDIEEWEDKIVVGFALKLNAIPSSQLKIFQFTSDLSFIIQPDLYVKAFGVTSKYQVEVGIWYFYELQIEKSGKGTAWCANNKIVEVTLEDTLVDNWHIMASCPVGSSAQNNIAHVDDVYVLDGSGETFTSRLGRTNSILRVPADTVEAGFSAYTASATNHASVAATVLNGDNSYVYTNVETQDLYSGNQTLLTEKEIKAVSILTTSRKEEPDPITIAPILKSGDVQVSGEDYDLLSAVYSSNSQVFEVDPATGSQWTKESVLAAQWGQRLLVNTTEDFPTESGELGSSTGGSIAIANSEGITIYEDT